MSDHRGNIVVVQLKYYHVVWLDTREQRVVGAARLRHVPVPDEPVCSVDPLVQSGQRRVQLKPLPCPPAGHAVVLVCSAKKKKKPKKSNNPDWEYCLPLSWIRGRVSHEWRPSYPLTPCSNSTSPSATSNSHVSNSERKSSDGC